jgi:hypothetical protein
MVPVPVAGTDLLSVWDPAAAGAMDTTGGTKTGGTTEGAAGADHDAGLAVTGAGAAADELAPRLTTRTAPQRAQVIRLGALAVWQLPHCH